LKLRVSFNSSRPVEKVFNKSIRPFLTAWPASCFWSGDVVI
jgi:hypothetical protein